MSPRLVPLILALLAWCCLASPWQSCLSDCRAGGLQPFGHGCHPVAESTHSCHCAHEACEEEPELSLADTGDTGGATHQCDDAVHLSIVFEQTEPEAGFVLEDPEPDPEPSIAATPRIRVPWIREIPSAVDPPGPEPQWMQQLRVDVLLL